MKKSLKSLIIVLIIVMCIVVLAGCVTRSRMIDKPTNSLTIRMTDGNGVPAMWEVIEEAESKLASYQKQLRELKGEKQ